MQITTFAVDLAKSKFQVHGYTAAGEKVLAKTLTRAKFLPFFEHRPERCRVAMEACGSAHHFARELGKRGYTPELLPPQHVAALLIGNKTDANDTDAIFEAARRPAIRRVPVKSEAQQDVLALHRVRERLIKARTALTNPIRGLLAERGVVFDKRAGSLKRALPTWLEHAAGPLAAIIADLRAEWAGLETRLTAQFRATPACRRLAKVEGIGVLTATATVASVGDAGAFRSGRQFAAWLGITPSERSSGQRRQLGAITKRGDGYLRKLLVHGARAAVRVAPRKNDARSRWITALIARRGVNKAVVAVANKNARILYALLSRGEDYRLPA